MTDRAARSGAERTGRRRGDAAPPANVRGAGGEPNRSWVGAARIAFPPALEATLVLVRHGQSTWLAEGRFQGQSDPPLSPLGLRQARLVGARLAQPDRPPRLPLPAGLPVAIYHSPLARTRETATAIRDALAAAHPGALAPPADAGRHGPPLVPDARLAEIAQGEWEGLLQAEIETRYALEVDGWRRDPVHVHAPGGEALASVDARVRGGLDGIIAALDIEARSRADRALEHAGPGAGGRTPEAAAPAGPGTSAGSTGSPPPLRPARSFYHPYDGPWALVVGHGGAFQVAILALLDLPLDRFWSFTTGPAGLSIIDIRNERAVVRTWNRSEHLAPIEIEDADAARLEAEATAERARSGAL